MTWKQHFRGEAGRQKQIAQPGPIPVSGVCGIPTDATPEERFRLTVDVERVYERETKAGDPCYFITLRDAEEMTFSVVVWESQWSRVQGRLKEGSTVTLEVRVPKQDYSAFGLVSVV